MPLITRPLTRDDFDQSMALIREAFGDLPPGTTPPAPESFPRPGYHAFGTFDEIASLVTWLASEECSFSTGAVFDLSGGRATY